MLAVGGGPGCPVRMSVFPEVFAVFGPTASGKSAVAEALADRLETEVVSADALQVYRGLPILTNQPERPTRLVAIRELSDEMSVGEYAGLAHTAVDDLVIRHGTAVVAGGTGLYLRAALADLELPPAPPPGARDVLEAAYDTDPAAAHRRLAVLDPRAASVVHATDRRRVVRALELAELGASLAPDEDRLWSSETRRPTLVAGLELDAELLEERIRDRAKSMIERGAVEEAARASAAGISRTAAQALGLEELTTLPESDALERIVVRTRRYAAYQRKWMRRIPGIVMIDADRLPDEVADAILEVARAR
jgi:tRNA dimethylallyltransferase